MISFMAIDLWQELPYNFKDLSQFVFSKSVQISAISNLSFHKSKVLKLSLIQVISNVSFPQFFQLFNLVICPSTPSFFYVHSNEMEANSITSRFFQSPCTNYRPLLSLIFLDMYPFLFFFYANPYCNQKTLVLNKESKKNEN